MPNPNPNMSGLKARWKEKALAKSKRLLKGQPKHKSEIYMNKAEYKAYIERYLELEGGVAPDLDQTKIGLQMYKELARQDENVNDEAAIKLIIEKAQAYAKELKQEE